MKPWQLLIVTSAVAGFLSLTAYAHYHAHPDLDHGYSKSDRDRVSMVIDKQIVPVPPKKEDRLLRAVIRVESGGDADAVSPKGAKGMGQAMPSTAHKPGYGVEKMKNHSVKEQLRFADDYLKAMRKKYGNTKLALAAYNAGPGKVDKVLAKMPKETRDYVKKVAVEYNRQYAMEEE